MLGIGTMVLVCTGAHSVHESVTYLVSVTVTPGQLSAGLLG